MDIAELRRQHEEIGLTARNLAQATADDSLSQGVGAIRWQLARLLLAHLALEDRILYPALQRATDSRTRTTAASLHDETGALAERFSRYMAEWSDDRVAREWAAFCAETRDILTLLGDRIDRENRILYPLAQAMQRGASPVARTG